MSRLWQLEEGGPLVKATGKHPWENRAFWRKQLRVFILQRDPICKICHRAGSTCVDHIKDFISPEGIASWTLFSSPDNLRGLCTPCHSKVTALYDAGFGHARKTNKASYVVPTGAFGRQFSSSVSSVQKLNEAIGTPEEIAELLSGIGPKAAPEQDKGGRAEQVKNTNTTTS